jgi:FAD:protein FMN transferase
MVSASPKVEVSLGFRAMNTDVLAMAVVPENRSGEAEKSLKQVQDLFAEVEAALSRFRPESDLSNLNRSSGVPYPASPMLFSAVELALRAARDTGGVFDPTILSALVGAGYDRSFELLADHGLALKPTLDAHVPTWHDVRLDYERREIFLPAGCGVDLGGIGKGWTVDLARLLLRPLEHFVVDAGGDLYVAGTQADGSDWTVAVDDPRRAGSDLRVLEVRDRAVATSTVARRRWLQGGQERHHLIDPRTGLPAVGDVLSATVVADSVARAETLAKAALILGRVAGAGFLNRQRGVAALLALADGRIETTGGFEELCGVS